jgi:hypothetical protein
MSTTDKYEQFKPTVKYPDKKDFMSVVIINTTTLNISEPMSPYERDDIVFPNFSKDERISGGQVIRSFTFDEEGFINARNKYRKSVEDGVDRFSDYLKNEYGHNDQIHQVIFTKAWEDEHSEGFYSVESEYSELSDFVDGIIAALGQEWEASWLHMVRT